MAHANIRDVATRAGVAVSTVSVVLNAVEGARVSDATRQRVQEAADALGYTPNSHARNLRGAKAGSIAVITDRITTSPYGVGLLEGAQEEAWRRDLTLLVLTTDGDPGREADALRYARGLRCQGIILATAQYEDRAVPRTPGLVLANCQPVGCEGGEADCPPHAVPDEFGCGRDSARHLIDLGHRQIAAIVSDSPGGQRRADGISVALLEAGLPPAAILSSSAYDATTAGGLRDAEELLTRQPGSTAVLAFNDRIAMGVYHYAARTGRRVPEDLTVVGADDIEPIAESLDPGLTTWAAPNVEIGEWAVQACLDAGHESRTLRHKAFPRTLIERGSTARAPAPESR